MLEMKQCPKCNLVTDIQKEFCRRDGTRLEPCVHCVCGYTLTPTDKFCEMCGKPAQKAASA